MTSKGHSAAVALLEKGVLRRARRVGCSMEELIELEENWPPSQLLLRRGGGSEPMQLQTA